MLFVPKQARDVKNLCETDKTHLWHPNPDISLSAELWTWSCAACGTTTPTPPIPRSAITLKELERMVDTSCSNADRVISDDQNVKGELWLMRSAIWAYWPYEFHIVYHILSGKPFVVVFRCYDLLCNEWLNVVETETYRELLLKADSLRITLNPSISV